MFDVWKMTLMRGKYVSHMHIVFTYCLYLLGIVTLVIIYGWPHFQDLIAGGKSGFGSSRRRLVNSRRRLMVGHSDEEIVVRRTGFRKFKFVFN